MAYKKHRASLSGGHLSHLAQALLLKLGVADCQHLIHHKDLRLQMRRHREGKPHLHAAGKALDRRVDELLHTREVYDLVEFTSNLGATHAEDGAIEINVL